MQYILMAFLGLFFSGSNSPSPKDIVIINNYKQANRSFWVGEAPSQKILLAVGQESTSGEKVTHRIKRVKVPGISGELRLTIYEGYFGCSTTYGDVCTGQSFPANFFHSFEKPARKRDYQLRAPEKTFPGIIIYVRKSNGQGITTPEEAASFQQYLSEL